MHQPVRQLNIVCVYGIHDFIKFIFVIVYKDIYQFLINNFVSSCKNKFNEITDAINTGDIKLAHRLVHTLKGNAGQVGKTLLQQAAKDVEAQLEDGKNMTTSERMAELEKELNEAIAEFTPMVSETVTVSELNSAAEPLDVPAMQKLLEELEPMLKNRNIECLKYIDGLRSIPGSEELIRQMESFNFISAMDSFIEIKKKIMDQ